MIQLALALLLPCFSHAIPVDLMARTPTEISGTVDRSATGAASLDGGYFSMAAIYQKISLRGKSYNLTATFTRVRGGDGVGLIFPVGEQKAAAVFGGWGASFDGLNRVNGQDPSNPRNPTSRRTKIVNGEKVRIKIQVRPDRVSVFVNDQPHFDLDPRANQISVLSDIDQKFDDGLGIYIVRGTLNLESWAVEQLP